MPHNMAQPCPFSKSMYYAICSGLSAASASGLRFIWGIFLKNKKLTKLNPNL